MKNADEIPVLVFETQRDWEAWLGDHHADAAGIWLQIAKAGSGNRSVSYAEALDGALCFGWIDGQKRSLDDQHWLQKFTPRRPKSGWSQVNRTKAEALIAAGTMRPAGLREVERAKADGRWDAAYASQGSITVPDDFQAALDQHTEARTFFDRLDSANRYAILYRIHTAKKAETRGARIQRFVEMLARGEKIHP